ncbi:sialidase family protein [Niabella drilacis]|uniref:exo-alpha-sialidase n=1 Tax=Niabella drilacis (strain DSM 25811 / CCM 8410 / CCUG 62505 / LMG 26954 / E90) TaxID=1285928 RepID=A0A1G6S948_NIADE|nr:sialidase family protein [Niabella drilacis]SDD12706.1 sialidase-1 [Niabella drilacis]
MKQVWLRGITMCMHLWVLSLLFSCAGKPSSVAPDNREAVVVFAPDRVYKSLRIPALVCTKQGSLLAFCEGRIGTASDWADMNLLMRRSTDEGKTWSSIHVIDSFKGGPVGNPVPIVDKNGIIHLLYQKDYKEGFYTYSADDGKTWAHPVNITQTYELFKPEYNWKVLAPGPGHGIQLSNGRLLSAVWLANSNKLVPRRSHAPSCVTTIYSDDGGRSWKRGAIIADSSAAIVNPNESMPVELSDGSVLMSIRNPSKNLRRAFSRSASGIDGWSAVQFAEELFDPTCMAPIATLPVTGRQGLRPLLFINPDSRDIGKHPRRNLSARISFDEGRTWPVHKVIDAGPCGYSDVAVGKDGSVYCLYESGKKDRDFNYTLVLKKLKNNWLLKK